MNKTLFFIFVIHNDYTPESDSNSIYLKEYDNGGYSLWGGGYEDIPAVYSMKINNGDFITLSTEENPLPVEIAALRERDGRSGAIVDDFRAALRRALLDEVEPQARTAPDDGRRVDAEAAHLVPRRDPERILRKLRDERRVVTVVRERHRHVRLAARVGHLELVRLHEAVVALGIEAHHDFTECDDLFHCLIVLIV